MKDKDQQSEEFERKVAAMTGNNENGMSNNPRDTQFAGFAKKLASEIVYSNRLDVNSTEEFFANWHQIIARRAYDLVQHTVDSCTEQEQLMNARMSPDYLLSDIPDLTTWPEEEK